MFCVLVSQFYLVPPGTVRNTVQSQVALDVVLVVEIIHFSEKLFLVHMEGIDGADCVFFGEEVEE